MPRIETQIFINAPRSVVEAVARDYSKYPEFMEEVKSITIIEQNEDNSRLVTDWVGYVKQFKLTMKWTQEDVWDSINHLNRFRQVKGDYDSMSGVWKYVEENGGCIICAEIDYEYNVPLLGQLVQKVIYNLVKKNITASLEAIKLRTETNG